MQRNQPFNTEGTKESLNLMIDVFNMLPFFSAITHGFSARNVNIHETLSFQSTGP